MLLRPPPRDQDGDVTPHDHPDIFSNDGIIRRISQHFIVVDEKAIGGRRISTMAFKPSTDKYSGLSIDIEKEILAAKIDPKIYVTTPYWTGSVRLKVQVFRDAECKVGFSPVENNPYHGEVWGITKTCQKALLKQCVWFVPIPNCSLY